MMSQARLQRLLGDVALRPLRQRLRHRYERVQDGGIVTLNKLNDIERSALCGLLGRRPKPGLSMRIDMAEIDAVLRASGVADSLRHALEILDGPIVNRRATRISEEQQWQMVCAACAEPRLAALVSDAKGLGLLKRLAGSGPDLAGRLCHAAQRVLAQLPAGAVARSHLAANVLGDAHALDAGRPVATLVLAALRRRSATVLDPASEVDLEGDETARAIWSSAGVLVNELARPVLFLNLPQQHVSRSGEPGYLSLRALLRAAPIWDVSGRAVFVCENPNLVAIAADALGQRCAPLVCTDGMPAAAQRTLLMQLKAAGACLYYHGDFDWPGIGIANVLIQQFKALPWRLQVEDYRLATALPLAHARPVGAGMVEAHWDHALSTEMALRQRAVDEEAVAQVLLQDLALNS